MYPKHFVLPSLKRELKVIVSDVHADRVGEMNPPQSL